MSSHHFWGAPMKVRSHAQLHAMHMHGISIYIAHAHAHTHIYIYIYIYMHMPIHMYERIRALL